MCLKALNPPHSLQSVKPEVPFCVLGVTHEDRYCVVARSVGRSVRV